MAPPRMFDHDEARRLHVDGWTVVQLEARFGVSWSSIARVVDPQIAERQNASARVPCVDCGKPASKYRSNHKGPLPDPRCRRCAGRLRATSVRGDALRCVKCKQWKPDDDFPANRCEQHRRGRHTMCRVCATEVRREYRELRKVACEGGCGRLVEGKGRANSRSGRNGRRIQLDPGRPHLCSSCATRRALQRMAAA